MKNIIFECSKDIIDIIPPIKPATKFVPDWYKQMSNYVYDYPQGKPQHATSTDGKLMFNQSIKKCIPVRDIMTSGYIMPLWADIAIEQDSKKGLVQFNWQVSEDVFQMEGHPVEQVKNSPIEKFAIGDQVWKIRSPWYIKTPPGYSVLINSPFYQDSNFEILPGIVDTDKHHIINYPFKWHGKDGQYIIPRDTPLVQITPFKRSDWTSEVVGVSPTKLENYSKRMLTKMFNYYKDFAYSQKKYR